MISRDRRFLGACAGALLLFAAAYSNSLDNDFHFDDAHVVNQNIFIRDLANVPRFFTDARTFSSLPKNQTYRPVVSLTLAVDYAIGHGLTPRAFHTTQLLLFAAVGVMLGFFYMKVFQSTAHGSWHSWAALFGAALYCIHTGNTQTGNYISARSELLSGIGVLGGFLLYAYSERARRLHLYLLPVAFGALAKNHAVMFAPLLFLYKLFIEEQLSLRQSLTRNAWPRVRHVIVSSTPAFVAAAALFVFVEKMNPPEQTYGGGDRVLYLTTQAWVWVRYVGTYFLPIGLSADTDLGFVRASDPRFLVGAVMFVASLVVVWLASASRRDRPIALGVLWFWLALLPTSSIVPLAEVMNDHRTFFPFMGLNMAVVWWLSVQLAQLTQNSPRLAPRAPAVATLAAAAVLLPHAAGTFQRNKVWRNDETLWADVARKSPKNGRGLMNYGLSQMRRGRYPEARALFERAREFAPNYPVLEVNLGIVTNAMGDPNAAQQHFTRALALDPNAPSVHSFYATWLIQRGRAPEAIPQLKRVIELSPGHTDAIHTLMTIYAATDATTELKALANNTLALAASDVDAQAYARGDIPLTPPGDRTSSKAWFDYGLSLTRTNQHLGAAVAYRRSVELGARNADSWNNLGWTLGKLGFFDAALAPLERAVALQPTNQLAKNNLAWVRGELRARR